MLFWVMGMFDLLNLRYLRVEIYPIQLIKRSLIYSLGEELTLLKEINSGLP
jgi:hypothetical protein